ncbi:hypothetical protein PILCRDRAFT_810982, partial [Piloderma croceum F 1598]
MIIPHPIRANNRHTEPIAATIGMPPLPLKYILNTHGMAKFLKHTNGGTPV